MTAAVDSEYEVWQHGREVPVVHVRLPETTVDIGYEQPGVTLLRGDIRSVLIRMAKDALEFRKLLDGSRVMDGCLCETGQPCPECVVDVQRQREYREFLAALEPPGT